MLLYLVVILTQACTDFKGGVFPELTGISCARILAQHMLYMLSSLNEEPPFQVLYCNHDIFVVSVAPDHVVPDHLFYAS